MARAKPKQRAKIEGFKDVVDWAAYSARSQMLAVAAGRISGGEQSVYLFELRGDQPKELARAAGTISYEVLSSLGTRLQRVYVEAQAGSERTTMQVRPGA